MLLVVYFRARTKRAVLCGIIPNLLVDSEEGHVEGRRGNKIRTRGAVRRGGEEEEECSLIYSVVRTCYGTWVGVCTCGATGTQECDSSEAPARPCQGLLYINLHTVHNVT